MNEKLDENVVCQELSILADEAMKNHVRAERAKNEQLCRMALAQVVLCQQMMEYYIQMEEDTVHLGEKLEEVLELQTSLYREARTCDDHDGALLALGRIRLLKTFLRRLADSERSTLVAFASPVMN